MPESNTYVGVVSGTDIMHRSTYQTLTTEQKISSQVQWAVFNKTPALQAFGLEAFGVDAMKGLEAFGSARSSGRIIQLDTGHSHFGGQVFTSVPTSSHKGRLGNYTPQLVEGGNEYAYAWHRLTVEEFIPDVDVDDNSGAGKFIDIKAQKMEGMKQQIVQDINYILLGNASAPDAGTLGPSAVYSDLPNLISVTQTRTVGGIPTTNSFWQNQSKAIASLGGGGEMDRPILLRRGLLKLKNDTLQSAEATDDYLLIATQGAWQYYDRLMYADTIQGRNGGGAMGASAKYDAAGINAKSFDGSPLVWDPAVTVPFGATAGTEAIYGVHIPTFKISIRSERNFKVTDWEQPRAHDVQKTLVSMIDLRYTSAVTARRSHFTAYNLPANPD